MSDIQTILNKYIIESKNITLKEFIAYLEKNKVSWIRGLKKSGAWSNKTQNSTDPSYKEVEQALVFLKSKNTNKILDGFDILFSLDTVAREEIFYKPASLWDDAYDLYYEIKGNIKRKITYA